MKSTDETRDRIGRGAAWAALAALWLCAAPASVLAQGGEDDVARQKAAESMYRLAVAEFKKGNYPVALDKLLEVQKLDPNPIILYNIARSYEEMEQMADAAEYFQRAAAHPDLPQPLQAEVGKRLPMVLPALRVREAGTLAVRTVGLGITQGADRSLKAYVASQKTKEVGNSIIINNNHNTVGVDQGLLWGGGATGLLGLGLVTAAAVVDLGLSGPIEDIKNPAIRADRDKTLALQDQISTGQTTATVLYITGGVALAAGGAMLTMALMSGEQAPAQSPEGDAGGSLGLAPFVGGGAAGLVIGGHFE